MNPEVMHEEIAVKSSKICKCDIPCSTKESKCLTSAESALHSEQGNDDPPLEDGKT